MEDEEQPQQVWINLYGESFRGFFVYQALFGILGEGKKTPLDVGYGVGIV